VWSAAMATERGHNSGTSREQQLATVEMPCVLGRHQRLAAANQSCPVLFAPRVDQPGGELLESAPSSLGSSRQSDTRREELTLKALRSRWPAGSPSHVESEAGVDRLLDLVERVCYQHPVSR